MSATAMLHTNGFGMPRDHDRRRRSAAVPPGDNRRGREDDGTGSRRRSRERDRPPAYGGEGPGMTRRRRSVDEPQAHHHHLHQPVLPPLPPPPHQQHRRYIREEDEDRKMGYRHSRSTGSRRSPHALPCAQSARRRDRSRSRDRMSSRDTACRGSGHQPARRERDRPRRGRSSASCSPSSSSRGVNAGSGDGKRWRKSSGGRNSGGSGRNSGDDEGHYTGQRGSMLGGGYELQDDVGTGTFGRVVECWDQRERRMVAVKVVRRVKRYHESALIEADILRDVNRQGGAGVSHCVRLLDQFDMGGHYCLVFERMGSSLYDLIKRNDYHGFPLAFVRDFARQLLEAVAFLHGMGLVHTDLKPENVLLCDQELVPAAGIAGGRSDAEPMMLPASTRIKVIDFGGATYVDDHKSSTVNTRQYRAPEVILGLGWCRPSDLWSCGCIIAELYQGELLFATHDNMEHLALMERCVGPFPRHMVRESPVGSKYFDSNYLSRWRRACPEDSRAHIRRMPSIEKLVAADASSGLGKLLEGLLELDPDKRLRASESLRELFLAPSHHLPAN